MKATALPYGSVPGPAVASFPIPISACGEVGHEAKPAPEAAGGEGKAQELHPESRLNHLVPTTDKGFSYQKKLKVTLLLIDLAMFVNYSVTDVAKDN